MILRWRLEDFELLFIGKKGVEREYMQGDCADGVRER
jgi:hypothetical protein